MPDTDPAHVQPEASCGALYQLRDPKITGRSIIFECERRPGHLGLHREMSGDFTGTWADGQGEVAASDEPREHSGTETGWGLSDDRLREITREQLADINLIVRGANPANILAVLEDRAKDWDGVDDLIAADYRTVARHIAAQGDVPELRLTEPSDDEMAAFKSAFAASADQPARWLAAQGDVAERGGEGS